MENGLRVRLDILETLPAEQSLDLATRLISQLRADQELNDAIIIIKGMGEGSWWIHLLIILGAAGTLVDRVPKLINDIEASEGPFGSIVRSVLDQYKGESCQVVSEMHDTIIFREKIANPFSSAHEEVSSSSVRKEVKIFLPGSFRRHNDGSQWFFAGNHPVRVSADFDIPNGEPLLVSGILTTGNPPVLKVTKVVNETDEDGNLNASTDFFNDRPSFETYGIDTSTWPNPFLNM